MNKLDKKIVLIGAGAVGTSFLYAAINQNLATSYEIIDVFENFSIGNKLDLEDVIASNQASFKISKGSYQSCKDADIIVITAGKPQKPNQTRLDLLLDNSRIIKDIALKIKASGFKGITIIASNPVDVITAVYQKITGFDKNKVIGSGTILDAARLSCEISKHLHVSPRSISAYVIGEHGDSSVSVLSNIKINGIDLNLFSEKLNLDFLNDLNNIVRKKAYQIIKLKRATFYGIGAALAKIVRLILSDSDEICVVGAKLEKYGYTNIYAGVPAIINKNGIKEVIKLTLNKEEEVNFHKSLKILESNFNHIWKQLEGN